MLVNYLYDWLSSVYIFDSYFYDFYIYKKPTISSLLFSGYTYMGNVISRLLYHINHLLVMFYNNNIYCNCLFIFFISPFIFTDSLLLC